MFITIKSLSTLMNSIKQTPKYISLYTKWFEKFKAETNLIKTGIET